MTELNPPGYSRAQWLEIEEAIAAAGLKAPEDLSQQVSLALLEKLRFDPKEGAVHAERYGEIVGTIGSLMYALEPFTDAGDISEGDWIADPLGRKYLAIRDQLHDLMTDAWRRKQQQVRYNEEMARGRSPSSGAAKPYQDDLWRSIARIWREMGGEVKKGRAYARFFEAVARPIYLSEFGRSHKLAWSDDNTFSEHVKKQRLTCNKPTLD